ncbi:7TM diverse intracellular signaling domain-containing protein [Pseudoalteromonas aurantia]|uniref:HTH LytTR-type domain-containing protein n=1 Tax=Pseudoalteromonas aurantia 208 TaxID=1314867 RepID=A0ABR9EEY5_9GAMM|nr:7TM diverse intracellular signaling domain-containing protein [Pseudoalteromonas aurantia]MBE0368959.1 hypothetical protein [Pseudoalteromonas aurantia 208]
MQQNTLNQLIKLNNNNSWSNYKLINSIKFTSPKYAVLLILIAAVVVLAFSLLSSTHLSEEGVKDSKNRFSIFTHFSHHKNTDYVLNADIPWHKSNAGTFNLGSHQHGVIKIMPRRTELTSASEELTIVLSKNNIFTQASLSYQVNATPYTEPMKSSSKDAKILSIAMPKNVSSEPLFILVTGRYLRGDIQILNTQEFTDYIKWTSVQDGLYFGFTALIFTLSLISYLLFRHAIFLKYAILLASISVWIAAGEGWLTHFIPYFTHQPFFTANSLGLLFFISFALFSYDYLKLSKQQRLLGCILKRCQLILSIIWLSYCLSFNSAEPTLYQIIYGCALLVCFTILTTSLTAAMLSYKCEHKHSLFYISALCILFLCGVISGLSMTSLIDYQVKWTLIKIGSALDMTLLATGLMYWYKQSLSHFSYEQTHRKNLQSKLATTEQQLADTEKQLSITESNNSLCPHIAKVVSLLEHTLYIKAAGNYSTVFYQNAHGIQEALIDTNIQAIENSIAITKLTRCHKSYLIGLKTGFHLHRRTSADYDLVFNQTHVPVGRKYLKEVKTIFSLRD